MPVTYRPGKLEDSRAVLGLFVEALVDLGERQGTMPITGGNDPEVMATLWERRRSLWDHLTRTAAQFWVAEAGDEVVGYARSTLREDMLQLTDFFVKPGHQSAGVGRELLTRSMPLGLGTRRAIIATTDPRAVIRYVKLGIIPRSVVHYFGREAEAVEVETDLSIEPVSASPEMVAAFGDVDADVLGYRRDVDHEWLMTDRQAYLYARGGKPVGYGYVGSSSGPFALLHERDFPAVLAHAESQMAEQGGKFGVELPLLNRVAVKTVLERGYEMDTFPTYFMTDRPFGRYENYVITSPPLFS